MLSFGTPVMATIYHVFLHLICYVLICSILTVLLPLGNKMATKFFSFTPKVPNKKAMCETRTLLFVPDIHPRSRLRQREPLLSPGAFLTFAHNQSVEVCVRHRPDPFLRFFRDELLQRRHFLPWHLLIVQKLLDIYTATPVMPKISAKTGIAVL